MPKIRGLRHLTGWRCRGLPSSTTRFDVNLARLGLALAIAAKGSATMARSASNGNMPGWIY